jgi:hypothetical protein
MKSEGTMLAKFISAGVRKRSLLLTPQIFFYPGTTLWFNVGESQFGSMAGK